MESEQRVTTETILGWFKEAIESKLPVPPADYLRAAIKLSVLLEDIDEEIVKVRMLINEMKSKLVQDGQKASHADIICMATPEFGQHLALSAKRERIMGFIQIAKKMSETSQWV